MITALLSASLLLGLSWASLGWLPPPGAFAVALALLGSVAAVALSERRPFAWFLAMALTAGLWGALLAPPAAPDMRGLRPGLSRLRLEIARSGCGATSCWSEGTLTGCEELEPGSCVAQGTRVGIASASELPRGARVTALAKLTLRSAFRNPLPTASWPDVRPDLYAKLQAGADPRVDELDPLDALLARARAAIRAALERTLGAPHAGIARALLLGEGAAVERELNDAIRSAGVSHVLAVSGMHVTLLVGALVTGVRLLWVRTPWAASWEARRVAAALGVALAPLIASLCGSAPSAVRAAWTSTLMYLVTALGGKPCALAVSSLIVALYAAIHPRDALNPGFVLSVLATAALLTHRKGAGDLLGALRESVRAWLATAVFLVLCFGQTSWVAVLANVALLPLGTALVPVAALHLLAALSGLARLLPSAPVFELASGAFVEAARFCAALDPGLLVPPLSAVQVIALTVVTGCLMLPLSRQVRLAVGAVALTAGALSEWCLRHPLSAGELRVTFVDVGQGDAILVETGSGETALIDAGGSLGGTADPGAQAVVPLLRSLRVSELGLVVLTHPHPDHYGGLRAVFDAVPVRELWDTGQAAAEHDGGAVSDLLALAQRRGTRVRRPGELCGAPHAIGVARLRVLAPCPGFDELLEPNDNSFVLRLEHGAKSFLLTGDSELEREARLTRLGPLLRSDVLKVGHHGSRTSSTAALLSAVSPWLAVVSAGRGNSFGHPHAEVVERLTKAVPQLLRTDVVGGVQVRSDGRRLTVRAWRPEVALAR